MLEKNPLSEGTLNEVCKINFNLTWHISQGDRDMGGEGEIEEAILFIKMEMVKMCSLLIIVYLFILVLGITERSHAI